MSTQPKSRDLLIAERDDARRERDEAQAALRDRRYVVLWLDGQGRPVDVVGPMTREDAYALAANGAGVPEWQVCCCRLVVASSASTRPR